MGNSLEITGCCSKVFIASMKLKAQHPCKTHHTPTIIHLLYIMPSFCPGPVLPNEKLQQILGHQPWRQNLSELQPRQPGCVPSKETQPWQLAKAPPQCHSAVHWSSAVGNCRPKKMLGKQWEKQDHKKNISQTQRNSKASLSKNDHG